MTSKRPTPDYLERAAYAYLGRFSSSAANLRRVLTAKARRRARRADVDWTEELDQEIRDVINALVEKLTRLDLINDRRYAEAKIAALHARGQSERAVRAALAAKGVDAAIVDDLWQAQFGDPVEAERAAAIRYVRRRRFGPYRAKSDRAARREKDLAAMARAGFGYGIAKDVLLATDAQQLEEELIGAPGDFAPRYHGP